MTLFPTGLAVLQNELMAEQASALGHSGRAAEAALARLARSEPHGTKTEIERLVDIAAECVWSLFIQREVCGLSNGPDVIEQYGIPGKVLARLGLPRATIDRSRWDEHKTKCLHLCPEISTMSLSAFRVKRPIAPHFSVVCRACRYCLRGRVRQ